MPQLSDCQKFQAQKTQNEFSKISEVCASAISQVLGLANASYARWRYVHKGHNKTLVMLYAAIGSFYSCGFIAAPWIIEKNFRRPGQIPTAILVFGLVFLIALLFWLAAIYMHRRKRIGRTLALIAAPITVFAFWPIGIYAWWFMHSEGGNALYGVKEDDN